MPTKFRLPITFEDAESTYTKAGKARAVEPTPIPKDDDGDMITVPVNSLLEDADIAGVTLEESGPDDAAGGLHPVVRSTDQWFNREVSRLEAYAIGNAALHAKAGLPRQDVPATEELEVETVLRVRSAEIFFAWAERVRRKIQDGIQACCSAAGDGLVKLKHEVDQFSVTSKSIDDTRRELEQRQRGAAGNEKSVSYGRLLSSLIYWPILGLLLVIEWIANVPVFKELFPSDASAEARLLNFSEGAHGLLAGLKVVGHRIVEFPESSAVALGLVMFLMLLCHGLGMMACPSF